MRRLLIIGGGGHAKVVADLALTLNLWDSLLFLDDKYPTLKQVLNFPILGSCDDLEKVIAEYNITEVFVAIGNNFNRLKWLKQCTILGLTIVNLIHPSAIVSTFTQLGKGILIMPLSIINCSAKIEDGCIINSAAVIEHDCLLQKAVHISPNAALAGEVEVGSMSWIGMGANVREQVIIGENVIVGAGSVVIQDIRSNQVVCGVPAAFIKENKILEWKEND